MEQQPSILNSDGPNNLSIGEGVTFVGSISAKGKAEIGGSVSGEITVDELEVAGSGVITGKIRAREMHIEGEVHEDIACSELALIHAGGLVSGKFFYGEVEIKKGGRILGLINVEDKNLERKVRK